MTQRLRLHLIVVHTIVTNRYYSRHEGTTERVHGVENGAMKALLGGFNFIVFWNFNGIQTQNDSYVQNSKFILSA
jgi:hypothetical protein